MRQVGGKIQGGSGLDAQGSVSDKGILRQLARGAVGDSFFNGCAATYPKEKKRTLNPSGSKILGGLRKPKGSDKLPYSASIAKRNMPTAGTRFGRIRNLRESLGTATTIARTASEQAASRWLKGITLLDEPVNTKKPTPAKAIVSPTKVIPCRRSRSLPWLNCKKASTATTTTKYERTSPRYGRVK